MDTERRSQELKAVLEAKLQPFVRQVVEQGVVEARATLAAGLLACFELVAEGHELVDFGDDAAYAAGAPTKTELDAWVDVVACPEPTITM